MRRAEARVRIERDEREREREEDDEEGLGLEEDEEVPVRLRGPPSAELLVAAVLLFAADAIEVEIAAEPESPHRCEHGREHAMRDVAVGQ